MSIVPTLNPQAGATGAMGGLSAITNSSTWLKLMSMAGIIEYTALTVGGLAKGINAMPDVVLGPVPFYGAHHMEIVKSDKDTRFRRMGGILLAFQAAENGDTILMNVRLAGPLSMVWMSLIDGLYQYGTSRLGSVKNDFTNLGALKASPLEGLSMAGDGQISAPYQVGVGILNTDPGNAPAEFSLGSGVAGKQGKYDDVKFGEQKNITADGSKGASISQARPPRWDDRYTYFAEHRTFTIVTRSSIHTNMYIESMGIIKDESMDFTEYEVTLAIRKFVKPLPTTFFKYQVMRTDVIDNSGKPAAAQLERATTAGGGEGSIGPMGAFFENNPTLVNGGSDPWTQDQENGFNEAYQNMNASSQKSYNAAINKYNEMQKVKTQVTLGPEEQISVEELSAESRIKASETTDYKLSVLWRTGWYAAPLIMGGGNLSYFASDPLVGKIIQMSTTIDPPEQSPGTATPVDVSAADVYQAYFENSQHKNPALQNPQPTTNHAWTASPTFLLTNPQTGQVVDYEAFVNEASFISAVTGGTSTELDDEFVVTPRNKQADFDNVVQFGCIVQKLTGTMSINGSVQFTDPDMTFSCDMLTTPQCQTENLPLYLTFSGIKKPACIGLTYFVGNMTPPTWSLVAGHYQINKSPQNEAYVYVYSLIKKGETFEVVLYLIEPAFTP